ncbi:MAG: hypothetical protein IT341_04515, partial [Chloroflexi bacterium]|nr:hypothetical protein [Chloroflexota bacterium]
MLPDWLAEPEPDAAWPQPETHSTEEASEPQPEPEPPIGPSPDEPRSRSWFSWVSGASGTTPAFLESEPEPAPEVEPEPESPPELDAEARPEPGAEAGAQPLVEAAPDASAALDLQVPPADDAERDQQAGPEASGPGADDWSEPVEDHWPAADALAPPPPPPTWSDDADSTRVLPTSWTPPPPPPPMPDDLEPEAGAMPAGSTAEQAVPWLIGLVLLLAGMVIVLLALIFAGDGSLGARPSPSASLAALLPSTTPRPSATPDPTSVPPSPSAAPSETPIALPEYGPLEMVYQGRAAALAPIYLLMHDFTTDKDPTVLAQDPNIDVRRFDWAPDGTVGVGVLEDFLVSIEPGAAKRTLAQGVTTVTFGDRTADVYAVRVTRDGGNDVAT